MADLIDGRLIVQLETDACAGNWTGMIDREVAPEVALEFALAMAAPPSP